VFVETCYYLCIMAPRKKKKDIGDIFGDAAKAVGRAAAQNPLVAQNIRYGRAVLAGPTAVAKTAAMDLAAGAVGAGVGKGAVGLGRAVAKTGVPARVANKLRGEMIGLHGSPVKGLKEIEPRLSEWSPEGSAPKAFAANPSFKPSSAPRGAGIPSARETALDYALGYSSPFKPKAPGSVYVVKAPKYEGRGKNPMILASPKPLKVVAEIEVMDPLRNVKLGDALRRAGVKVPKKK
jgi:hypothetical protein